MAIPQLLRDNIVRVSAALVTAGVITSGGIVIKQEVGKPSAAVQIAMEVGAHYESGGRHIGKPYRDNIGKGRPWTVCHGITGPEVDPSKYYSREDCKALELPKYRQAEKESQRIFTRWSSYNVWVQASLIDMTFNLGATAVGSSSAARLANQGNLDAACAQMPRWVYGTVDGMRVRLAGLTDRRETTRELCAEWGRSGHFL